VPESQKIIKIQFPVKSFGFHIRVRLTKEWVMGVERDLSTPLEMTEEKVG
jgi:hypothetical protein